MRRIAVLFFSVVSLVAVACQKSPTSAKNDSVIADGVIGGKLEKNHSEIADVTVALRDPKTHDPFCTATIIADRVLLTAAHCVSGLEPAEVQAAFHANGASDDAIIRGAKVIWAHEDFQSVMEECPTDEENWSCSGKSQIARVGTRNDLALILLKNEVPRGYHPVRFAADDSWRPALPKVTIAGYGIDKAIKKFNRDNIKQMRANSGKLRSLTRVASVMMENVDISEKYQTILVESDPKESMCSGDSGGPLFVGEGRKLLQIGVSSYLFDGAEAMPCGYKHASFTDVSLHSKWIVETTEKMLNGKKPSPLAASVGVSMNHPRMLETTNLTMNFTCDLDGARMVEISADAEGNHLISVKAASHINGNDIQIQSDKTWTETQASINLSHDVFGADRSWESSSDRAALLKALFNRQPLGATVGDLEKWTLSINEDNDGLFEISEATPDKVTFDGKGVHVKLTYNALETVKTMDCKAVLTLKNPAFWP